MANAKEDKMFFPVIAKECTQSLQYFSSPNKSKLIKMIDKEKEKTLNGFWNSCQLMEKFYLELDLACNNEKKPFLPLYQLTKKLKNVTYDCFGYYKDCDSNVIFDLLKYQVRKNKQKFQTAVNTFIGLLQKLCRDSSSNAILQITNDFSKQLSNPSKAFKATLEENITELSKNLPDILENFQHSKAVWEHLIGEDSNLNKITGEEIIASVKKKRKVSQDNKNSFSQYVNRFFSSKTNFSSQKNAYQILFIPVAVVAFLLIACFGIMQQMYNQDEEHHATHFDL